MKVDIPAKIDLRTKLDKYESAENFTGFRIPQKMDRVEKNNKKRR